jgi:hypothetical protein
MPNRPVRIEIGSPSSQDSRDEGHVTLHAVDAMSGEVLVDLKMTSGLFWRLCQGGSRTQMGFVSGHLERVGKSQHHESITVPRELLEGVYKAEDVRPIVEEWMLQAKPDHWEVYRITQHNYGWAVHGTWWVDPTPEELQQFLDERYL